MGTYDVRRSIDCDVECRPSVTHILHINKRKGGKEMKERIIHEICNNLNAQGLTLYDMYDLLSAKTVIFTPVVPPMKQLLWLPEENLEKIAEFDCSGYKDCLELFKKWKQEGFFDFTPYRVSGSGNPMLCLKHNMFLSLAPDGYFAITDTDECENMVEFSPYWMDDLIACVTAWNGTVDSSKLMYALIYASLISCGFRERTFRRYFYEHRNDVDTFVQQLLDYYGIHVGYTYGTIEEYITRSKGNLAGENVYQILAEGKPVCRFTVDRKMMQVEYCSDEEDGNGNCIITFSIPGVLDGIDIRDDWDAARKSEYVRDCGSAMQYEKVQQVFLGMLLEFVGVHANEFSIRPFRKLKELECGDKANFIDTRGFHDVKWCTEW